MSTETGINQEILKKVYVDPVENAVIKTNVLRNKIKFDSNSKTGNDYTGAIMLRRPQGFTFAGGASRTTAFNLNGAVAGLTKQVTVTPFSTVLEEDIAYEIVAASAQKDAAFSSIIALTLEAMVSSHDQMYELNLMYGGGAIGTTNTNTGATPNGIHQVSKATWSPHVWGPLEGGRFDVYSDAALTTKVTASGAATLTAVDMDTRTLYVTYASGADYTAANAASAALYFTQYGAVGNIGLGVVPLITTSAAGGSVFGLTTSGYGYMRASSATISGALTFTKIAQAATLPATKGGMGDLDVLLNVYSWTDVMNDQSNLRQYVGNNGGTFENGADELIYHGPNGGKLTIQCDPMLKATEGLILGFEDWRSVGSSLPTFNLPGSTLENPKFFRELERNAGFGIRRYSSTGTYCRRLARQCLMTGIVNTSGPAGGGT